MIIRTISAQDAETSLSGNALKIYPISQAQLLSDRANCILRVGGLRSPEASASTRAIAYGAWRQEVMFTHFIWLSRVLLSTKTCSALEVKSHLSRQRILSQLGNAAQCLTCSMCQFEALGASSLLKLLVTHLWTLFWTVLFICVTWLDSFLLPTKICSVLDVKPRLSRQHVLSQLEIRDDGAVFNPYDVLSTCVKTKFSSKQTPPCFCLKIKNKTLTFIYLKY